MCIRDRDIGDIDQEGNTGLRRTDTMMVFNYNPITDVVNIVSIPRDTLIEVEDAYDSEGNYIPYWKINAAYALGGEDELVMQVKKLLEIDVNYIVEIDYKAFRSIIDAIGGIEMYIDRNTDQELIRINDICYHILTYIAYLHFIQSINQIFI